MAIKSIHCKLGIVDPLGNVTIISPRTTGSDIKIRDNGYGSGETLQSLVDNLGEIAFSDSFLGIDDSLINSENKTWSANKIVRELNMIKNNNGGSSEEFTDNCHTIASAVDSEGVTTFDTDSPTVISNKMAQVYSNKYNNGKNAGITDTKKGNATPAQVLSGYTFTSANGVNQSGGIENRGDNGLPVLSFGQSVTSSAGYYSRFGATSLNTEYITRPISGITLSQLRSINIPLNRSVLGSRLKIIKIGIKSCRITIHDYNHTHDYSDYSAHIGDITLDMPIVATQTYNLLRFRCSASISHSSYNDITYNVNFGLLYTY